MTLANFLAQCNKAHLDSPRGAARREVDAQGKDAHDDEDQDEDAAKQVAPHVFIGGDETRPGLELVVGPGWPSMLDQKVSAP